MLLMMLEEAFSSSRVDSDKDGGETASFIFLLDEAWGPKESRRRPLTIASARCTIEAEATVPVFNLWPAKSMFW